MNAKEYAENRIAEIMRSHGNDRAEREALVFSAEDVVQELKWVLEKNYVDISDEQMKKLPDGFCLYACPYCECSLFAIDQDTLEKGDKSTEICCLGCGNVFLV